MPKFKLMRFLMRTNTCKPLQPQQAANNDNNQLQNPQIQNPNNNRHFNNTNFLALYAQNAALRRELQDVQTELQRVGQEQETHHFGILNASIRALQPAQPH